MVPPCQDLARPLARSILEVGGDHSPELIHIVLRFQSFDLDELWIVALLEGPLLIEDVGQASRHARPEVPPGGPQDDDHASGHVLAPMVANALDNGPAAAVPHTEALARSSRGVKRAAGGPVEAGVADDHVLVGLESGIVGRGDDDLATVHALADVVVRFAGENELETADAERSEALSRAAPEATLDRAVEALIPVVVGDLAGQLRPNGPPRVADLVGEDDRRVLGDGVLGLVQDQIIQVIVRPVVALAHVPSGP